MRVILKIFVKTLLNILCKHFVRQIFILEFATPTFVHKKGENLVNKWGARDTFDKFVFPKATFLPLVWVQER